MSLWNDYEQDPPDNEDAFLYHKLLDVEIINETAKAFKIIIEVQIHKPVERRTRKLLWMPKSQVKYNKATGAFHATAFILEAKEQDIADTLQHENPTNKCPYLVEILTEESTQRP